MKLNQNSMTYKIYSVCYLMSKKLFGAEADALKNWPGDEVIVPTNTNLCSLMRTILIWTPMYFLIGIGLLCLMGFAVFILPSLYGGAVGYFNTYGIPAIIVASFVGFHYINLAINKLLGRTEVESTIETREEREARHEQGKYTVWETIRMYFTALHTKTCPLIEVIDEPVLVAPPVPSSPSVPVETPKAEIVESADVDESPSTDVDESVDAKHRDEVIDEIIEALDDLDKEDEVEEVKPSRINMFIVNKFPSFQVFFLVACLIGVIGIVNSLMAWVMEEDVTVFEKGQCAATYTYDVDEESGIIHNMSGKISCGEYDMNVSGVSLDKFITQTELLKKVPHCSVVNGTLTDDTDFDCEYK